MRMTRQIANKICPVSVCNLLWITSIFCLYLLTSRAVSAQQVFDVTTSFHNGSKVAFTKTGRGICEVKDEILKTKNAYAAFGDTNWRNYEFEFCAKVPASAKQVQIWAGFRATGRVDRYVIGLKGGVQNELYLARIGYMGRGEFLTLRHLDFPLKPGQYYKVRVQVVGGRIRIFLNDESLPRIDLVDDHSSFEPKGRITLGGSWIENDFSRLSVRSLPAGYLENIPEKEYAVAPVDQEALKKKERSTYKAVKVKKLSDARTVISLDGKWLFKPNYEIGSQNAAISVNKDDQDWHTLKVPDFWNPNRVWIWGEGYKNSDKLGDDSYYHKETARCEAYTFDYKKTDIGWYRQWIDLPQNIEGKHIELHFDAVAMMAEVWINGKKAGGHTGMFADFSIDGTGLFRPGKNLVVVKVYRNYKKNNTQDADKIVGVAASEVVTKSMLESLPHGFYFTVPEGGIWQPVSLVITNPVKITSVFIKPGLQGAAFDITIKNYSHHTRKFSLNTNILSFRTGKPLYKGLSIKDVSLAPGEQKKLTYNINNLQPELWSPAHPNLYDFYFILSAGKGKKIIDEKVIRSGFKTFTAKDGFFYLNGKRYWLRGADQTPMPIAPNDTALAARFCRLMHEGHIEVTRTHNSPYSEAWMKASDKYGIGVSYEGTWTWMMSGDTPVPDTTLLKIWADGYLDLVRKYRNDPSMLIWDINNEMYFYANDPDKARAEKKMEIISNLVKRIRQIDPTHPVCFSSYYSHKQAEKRFGAAFMKKIDDGDMDDIHAYPNWYSGSVFDDFRGEFQKEHKYPGRALISQEMSTGYPDETGHPARFYTFVQQTPQALIGNYSYEFKDPKYFLQVNAFLTKEEAEALRRTNPEAAGILHFSLATWLSNFYLAKKIRPFPTYYAIKKALQPVLVSAELWGRHFYAGTRLPVRICVVNDRGNGRALPATTLVWRLTGSNGASFAHGSVQVPPVKYYGRRWITPEIDIPANLPKRKLKGKLVLELYNGDKLISENDYSLLFAARQWAGEPEEVAGNSIAVVDFTKKILPVLGSLKIKYSSYASVKEALGRHADVYLLSGLNSLDVSQDEIKEIRSSIRRGMNIILLNSDSIAHRLFPKHIRGVVKANPEIAVMDIPESPVFNGINLLETRYFNNNEREVPAVCSGAFQINRGRHVSELASSLGVHGYLPADIHSRVKIMDRLGGAAILKVSYGRGTALLSTMLLGKGNTDPVAGKLLSNILNYMIKIK